MDEKQMIDDIIATIEGTMAQGAGHVNVNVDENGKIKKEITSMGCLDISDKPMACQVPTIFLDGEDE